MGSDFYCEQVLNGKTKVDIVEETDNVIAFRHTNPSWLVHIIVIPKKHIPSLLEMTAADNKILLEMMSVIQKITKKVLKENGKCRLTTNFGDYQTSKHLHWHIYVGSIQE